MPLEKVNLSKWKFYIGENRSDQEQAKEVTIPHTWNVEKGTEDYAGNAWYYCDFYADPLWEEKRVELFFHAVYHDASVYLNGEKIGEHINSGYTPFSIELTKKLKINSENRVEVLVNNEFSDQMLPCENSFDWANDGGIIRPVELLISGKTRIKHAVIKANPIITVEETRQDEGSAVFGVQVQLEGQITENTVLCWKLYEGLDEEKKLRIEMEELVSGEEVEIPGRIIEDIAYWHFDMPRLYMLVLQLKMDGKAEDRIEIVFGFRDFHINGYKFYLNGEQIRLCGTEWMPGSNPDYGMAESKEQLEKMLLCLKESNSILTRFHWQQDDWVYDWCDRNGMLVQEEVPYWGKNPPVTGEQQWKIFKEQIQEMITAHRNHPSILFWGVGNELDAQDGATIQYIKDAVSYTHQLDRERFANYVSNSIFPNPAQDGTTVGDIMMINDYIGTWHTGFEQYEAWDNVVKLNPGKPMIPSEFGLCEPAFTGGDERRGAIFLDKIECYRKYPNIMGTVYFCLNDYRTQMGEDGERKFRKRIHGSTDLLGDPKASYWIVKKEYAPVCVEIMEESIRITCKESLPRYTVKGYYMEYMEMKTAEKEKVNTISIPTLEPGESYELIVKGNVKTDMVKIYRPNGNRVW